MKKLILTVLTTMVVLTGCNTIKGLGKDISRTGEAVTDGAKKVQDKI